MAKVLVGVTGNIASGKSTVAQLLKDRGCALVDADVAAHELYQTNAELRLNLAQTFGEEVLSPSGEINRALLAEMVFSDKEQLERLNALVRPALFRQLHERIEALFADHDCVVVDAALIVEWGMADEMDLLVMVTAPEALRRERLMQRSGYTRVQAEQRIASQMPESDKAAKAHIVISNVGSLENLKEQITEIWREIMARRIASDTKP